MRRLVPSLRTPTPPSQLTPGKVKLTATLDRLAVESDALKISTLRKALEGLSDVVRDLLKANGTDDELMSVQMELDILIDRIIKPLSGRKLGTMPDVLRSRVMELIGKAERIEKQWLRSDSYRALYPIIGVQQQVLVTDVNVVKESLEDLVNSFLMKDFNAVENILNDRLPEIAQQTSAAITAKGVLKTSLSLMKESLDGVPVPGLKGAAGGLLEVIRALELTSSNVDDLNDLIQHVNRLQNLVASSLKDKTEADVPPMLRDRVKVIESALEQVGRAGKSIVDRHAVRRFFDRAEDAGFILTLRDTIRRALAEFMLEGDITIEFLLGELAHRALLNELPVAPNAQFDSGLPEAKQRASCLEGTRVAVLKDIYEWIEDCGANVPRIYWLNGLAGTGKSTIAQSVAKKSKLDGILAASFFFSQDEERLKDPLLLFTTIAYQLAYYNPAFKLRIVDAIKATPSTEKKQRNVEEQLQELIISPLQPLKDVSPSPALIILDALDACSFDQAALKVTLLNLDRQLSTLPFPLKVFITSRPEEYIKSAFANLSAQSFSLQEIKDLVTREDIRVFLSAGLKVIAENSTADLSGWPTAKQVADLATRAGTLFIHASTALAYIENPFYNDPRRQLATLLDAESSSSSAYRDLDDLYLRVLRDAVPEGEDGYLLERFQAIVGAVVAVFDPQPSVVLEKLLAATTQRQYNVRGGLARLHSVFVVPKEDIHPIRIFHPSFYDFLTRSGRCADLRFVINEVEHHAAMARACFAVMERELRRDICGISHLLLFNWEVKDLRKRIEQCVHPHLQYACAHWVRHVVHGFLSNDPRVVEHLDSFCQKKLLQWLEACSLLGGPQGLRSTYYAFLRLHQLSKEPGASLTREIMGALEFLQLCFSNWSLMDQASQVYRFLPESPEELRGNRYPDDIVSFRKLDLSIFDVNSSLPEANAQGLAAFSLSISPQGKSCAISFSGPGKQGPLLLIQDTGSILMLRGLDTKIKSTAYSPDGRHLASASEGGAIQIWDTGSGILLKTLVAHTDGARYVTFSPDGDIIASASHDNTARLWNWASGEYTTIEGFLSPIMSMAFSRQTPPLVVTQTALGRMRLWCSASGAARSEEFGRKSRHFTNVAISSDGAYVLAEARGPPGVDLWRTNPQPSVVRSWRTPASDRLKSLSFFDRIGECCAILQYINSPTVVHQIDGPALGQEHFIAYETHLAESSGWITRWSALSGPQRLLYVPSRVVPPFRILRQVSIGDIMVLVDCKNRLRWLDFSDVPRRKTVLPEYQPS